MNGKKTYYAYATVKEGEPLFRQKVCYYQQRKRQVGDEVLPEVAADPLTPDASGVFALDNDHIHFKKMQAALEKKKEIENAKNPDHPRVVGPADTYEGILVMAYEARPKTHEERAAMAVQQASYLSEENAKLKEEILKLSKSSSKAGAKADKSDSKNNATTDKE